MMLRILWSLLVLAPAVAFAQDESTARKEVRALWITRGEYRTAADVKKIIENAAWLNFNVLLFQVRGNGTVFYRSKIEPWAFELTSKEPATTGKDPGWDPLAVAVAEAHARGLELHAYMNVFPAWRSRRFPPRESKQLWWSHPEWFMHDAAGDRMLPRDRTVNPKVADWYSFLSPGVPEVQDYLASLAEEIARNYEVDGLHYDYIRYPHEITEVRKAFEQRAKKLGNWSYDPVSLRRFTQETGVAKPDADPTKWMQWRSDQVTATVRKMSERARAARPKLIISAAVFPDPAEAKRNRYQSYLEWMEKGYLDVAMTMGYTQDSAVFRKRCETVLKSRPRRGYVVAGIAHKWPESAAQQIQITRELGDNGFAGFSYQYLFNIRQDHIAGAQAKALKSGLLAQQASVPWK